MANILLIEDDDSLRSMLHLTLKTKDYQVTEARNGKEGLLAYERKPAEVVITDLIMPEKEGLETILELKRKYPAVRIIAMSGNGSLNAGDYLSMARQFGAVAILAKPFSTDELMIAIDSALKLKP